MIAEIEIFTTKEIAEVAPDIAVEMIIGGVARLLSLKEGEWSTCRETTENQFTDIQGHKVVEVRCVDGMNMLD